MSKIKSDCFKCEYKKTWQCWKLYDGDTCPSYIMIEDECMSKNVKGEYLQKKEDSKDEVKEQMIYGSGDTIEEKKKKRQQYKDNQLNE